MQEKIQEPESVAVYETIVTSHCFSICNLHQTSKFSESGVAHWPHSKLTKYNKKKYVLHTHKILRLEK